MAVITDNLTPCPKTQAEIIGRTIRQNSLLDYITPHNGYTDGPFRYRFLTAGGNLGNCCEPGDGNLAFDQTDGEAACIKYENRFCGEALMKALNDFEFRVTAGNERIDGRLTDAFAEESIAYVSNLVSNLIAKGDTTSSDPNLAFFDGLIKQATEGGVVIATPEATNLWAAIIEAYRALPDVAKTQGEIAVVLEPNHAELLHLYLIQQNYYHYNPGTQNSIYDRFRIPGLGNITIVPEYGFTGTNQILVTPRRNMHWFTNIANDYTNLFFGRCECADEWLLRIRFILGVLLLMPEWAVIMTLTDDIINAPFCINVCASSDTSEPSASPAMAGVDLDSPEVLAAALEKNGYPIPAALKKAVNPEDVIS